MAHRTGAPAAHRSRRVLTPPSRPRESATPPSRPPGPVSCSRGWLPWPRTRCRIPLEPASRPLAMRPSGFDELGSGGPPHRSAGRPRRPLFPTRARPTLPSGLPSTVCRKTGPCRRRDRAWRSPTRRAGPDPWSCVGPGWRDPLGSASGAGTHGSSCDGGCSVGTFAWTSCRSSSVDSAGCAARAKYTDSLRAEQKGPHPEKVCQKAPSNGSGGKVRCYSPRRFTSGHLAGSQARDRSPSPKVSTVGERLCGLGMAVVPFEEAAERTWARVVERARDQLPESSFSMWFVGVRATSLHDGVLEVTAPSDYVRDWLAKHYLDLIQGAATDFVGQPVRVQLGAEREPERGLIAQAQAQAPAPERQARTEPERGARELPFPNFTFETFVAGPSNRFAHAAAMAVAEAPPSKAYNPLFIYGGGGVGKTPPPPAISHPMHPPA